MKINEEKDKNINDLYKKNDIAQKKIENLNSKINSLNAEKNETTKKYNNANLLYEEISREVNKLEKKLEENDIELNNVKKENEKDKNNLIESNKKYNEDYNNLNKKFIKIQEQLNKYKEENQSLLNKNSIISSKNETLLAEKKFDKEIISSYKETIDKLNKEISQLNKENEKNKKEIIELKNKFKSNLNRSSNSAYEDEIIIVNRETTYSRGVFSEPNEFNKYGLIKNKYDIQKNEEIKNNEIFNYHEIIQDLTNMILLYEKFFFKDKVKPKNIQELFYYLITQFIDEKVKNAKINVFVHLMHLFIDRENQPKIRYIRKNNTNFKETKYEKSSSNNSEKIDRKNMGYFNERNKINNKEV